MYQSQHQGFTLIEVLVALIILAIALVAIIQAVSANARNTYYLENKTTAQWVALNIFNEYQIGLRKPSDELGEQTGSQNMLNSLWKWQANFQPSADKASIQIDINVKRSSSSAVDHHLTGFLSTS